MHLALRPDGPSGSAPEFTQDVLVCPCGGRRSVVVFVADAGHIEQVGAPLDVYHRPRTRFAAGFLGSPRMNFIGGEVAEVTGSGVVVKLTGGGTVTAAVAGDRVKPGDPVTVGARPEHLRITAPATPRCPPRSS